MSTHATTPWAVPAHPARVFAALGSRFVLASLVFLAGWAVHAVAGVPDPVAHQVAWVNALLPVTDVASVVLVAWLLRAEGKRLRDVVGSRADAGLQPSVGREVLASLGVFALFLVTFVATSFLANLAVYGGAPPASPAMLRPPVVALLLQLVVMPITVGIAEEVVYRGYALPRLAALFGGRAWPAVLVQALFFGLQHVAFFWGVPGPGGLAKFLAMFLSGLVLGAIYVRQRRLVPLIVAHVLLDLLGFGPMALAMLLS